MPVDVPVTFAGTLLYVFGVAAVTSTAMMQVACPAARLPPARTIEVAADRRGDGAVALRRDRRGGEP